MSDSEKGKNFIDKIKSNKKFQVIIIVALSIAVIMIFISNFTTKQTTNGVENTIDEYVVSLEKRLEETLSKVEGAGAVSVVITVESGMETDYATEKTIKQFSDRTETNESLVIINGKPIVLREKYPKVTGVLIVVKGANNISVLSKIQQATMSLLDININQIEILKMK